MTKDKFDINPNWKWGWSPITAVCNNTCDDADADDEKRGYFQTETELVAAFLFEVIKPKLSDDAWDTLIKAIHNERVGSSTGRIQTIGRVLADILVIGVPETRASLHGRVISEEDDDDAKIEKEERAAKERLLEELNDFRAAKYYSATKFY
jgi:hypothetical protein